MGGTRFQRRASGNPGAARVSGFPVRRFRLVPGTSPAGRPEWAVRHASVVADECTGKRQARSGLGRMYLRRFAIRSIRSIKKIEMDFARGREAGWHVILGPNGAGKSSVVRSFALLMM